LTDIAYFIYLFFFLFFYHKIVPRITVLSRSNNNLYTWSLLTFIARHMQSAILLYLVCLSVRPSVCPSRGGMVFKRMHTLGVFGAGVIFAPGDRWKTLTLTLTLTPTFYRLYSFAFSLDRLERSRYLYSSTSSHAMRKTFLVWFPISVL